MSKPGSTVASRCKRLGQAATVCALLASTVGLSGCVIGSGKSPPAPVVLNRDCLGYDRGVTWTPCNVPDPWSHGRTVWRPLIGEGEFIPEATDYPVWEQPEGREEILLPDAEAEPIPTPPPTLPEPAPPTSPLEPLGETRFPDLTDGQDVIPTSLRTPLPDESSFGTRLPDESTLGIEPMELYSIPAPVTDDARFKRLSKPKRRP